jgi:hypothetical protein
VEKTSLVFLGTLRPHEPFCSCPRYALLNLTVLIILPMYTDIRKEHLLALASSSVKHGDESIESWMRQLVHCLPREIFRKFLTSIKLWM